MKRLILVLSFLMVQSSNSATQRQFKPQEQVKQQFDRRLQIQQERVRELEEFFSWKRRNIERWHTDSMKRLRQSVELRVRNMPSKDRFLWVEFWKMHSQKPHADGYFQNTGVRFRKEQDQLRLTMKESYFLAMTTDLLLDESFRLLLADIADNYKQDPLRREALRLLPMVDEFQLQAQLLERRRKASLAQLEKCQKEAMENASQAMLEIETQAERFEPAIVSAIGHSSTGSFCLIKGVDGTLEVGDEISGVRIAGIRDETVEFEKNGMRWIQGLGAAAGPEWQLNETTKTAPPVKWDSLAAGGIHRSGAN